MSENTMIEGTKEDARILKWLQKAQSKDQARPVLTGIHSNEKHAVACDGFRIHLIEKRDCLAEINNKTINLKIPTGGDFIARAEVM